MLPRAVRGTSHTGKSDGVYRAAQRGESSHMRGRALRVAAHIARGAAPPGQGKATLLATRESVVAGWPGVSERLGGPGPGSRIERHQCEYNITGGRRFSAT
jgi:hypothetical protein